MPAHPTIQEILQSEFSPPLDTSLIAAIVDDYISGEESKGENELRQLREVLSNLACSAEKELLDADERTPLNSFQPNPFSNFYADDASSSFDYSTTENSGYASTSSGSDGSGQPLSHPLGFLHALFPQVSTDRLKAILGTHDGQIDDINMELLVEEVLTNECLRELEERGLDESDSKGLGYNVPWELAEKKRGVPKQKKHFKKSTTFTLVDIRQQQHVRQTPSSSRTLTPDPWTQLASVASHLATLIPSQSELYFQSVFHSPKYTSPGQALRAALVQIARKVSKNPNDELTAEESPFLFSMFEILTTSQNYADLDVEARDQHLEDALFALRATGGDPGLALDVVQVLVELDADLSTKEFAWGVYHQQAPQLKAITKVPPGPPNIPPAPNIKRGPQALPLRTVDKPTQTVNPWKTIPIRPSPDGPHPLDGVVRAYSNHIPTKPSRKMRAGGNGKTKGGSQTPTSSSKAVQAKRQWELQEQRRAALREAGKAWQKGNSKNHGGEIAFFFAERARELQEEVQREQLRRAREMVMATRTIKPSSDLIDLHGLIVVEAVEVSREYLTEHFNNKPVKIITGRGNHSANGVGVLGPAVKNALVSDGWIVETVDGGLVVHGYRGR